MKTNEWMHEEMSLKVQVNQKKPKKSGETIANKKKQILYPCSKRFKGRCNHCGKYGHKKTLLGTSWTTQHRVKTRRKRGRSKGKRKI